MLKSSGRTNEVLVMRIEEWPQVVKSFDMIIHLLVRIRVRQKSLSPERRGMPYAKRKNTMCR